MRRRSLAVVAAAAASAVAILIPSNVKADSTIDYDPVVSVLNQGATSGDAYPTSIDLFNNSVAAQVAPISSQTYSGLLNTNSTAEMALSNNPGVADAAAAGNPYAGTAYVFSAGYAGPAGSAITTQNRIVGDMTVTSAGVTNPTLGASYTAATAYATSTIRGAVGDDTATNFWTAGNGNGGTEGIRYWNNNLEISNPPENTRTVQIRQGQLYGSADNNSASGVLFAGIFVSGMGTPMPTVAEASTAVPLFVTGGSTTNISPYSFLLIDDPNNPNTPTVSEGTAGNVNVPFNVAYIADNGDPTGADSQGGIEKWIYNNPGGPNNGWSLAYIIGDGYNNSGATGTGYFGIAGQLRTASNPANDSVLLYATSTATSTADPNNNGGGSLEQFVDPLEATTNTAADATEITLATAPGNEQFRGVALAPIVGPANLTWNNIGGSNPSDGKTWDIGFNNNWNNESATTVYTDGSNVTFNDANGGPLSYLVTLDSTVKPGSITVNNSAGNYSISGTGTIGGTGSLSKSGSDTLTLSTANTYSGGTNVSAGTLLIEPTSSTTSALPDGALSISGTGKVQLASNVTAGSQSANVPTSAPTSNVNITSLSITGSGTLDIGNNHIIIDYGSGPDPISTIASLIADGAYGSGTTVTWSGTGITSSAAAANSKSYGIGYADAADTNNPAGLSAGQIEIMYTLLGDANLDGKVNGIDFNLMATNFNQAVTDGWDKGDFNYDGKVNGIDFNLLAGNFNQLASQSATSAADLAALDAFAAANGISLTSVPEPGSIGLLAAGAVGLLARRRGRRR